MATEANTGDAGSIKNAIRWGLLLAAVGTVGYRMPRLVSEFRQWREALGSGDAISTESWHAVLKVDLASSLIVLAIAVGAFYLLRPRTRAAQ